MIKRRTVVQGIASVPLASVLASTQMSRARAAETQMTEITTSAGSTVSAAVAQPQSTPAASIILIHEWWGLNDQIKAMAAEVADMGYTAVAVDLYKGEVAASPDAAKSLMQSVDPQQATDTLSSWINWSREQSQSNGKVATLGWCFGGGWSLNASLAADVDATVIYYGRVAKTKDELASLNSPVLGHFATEDKFINKEMVSGFEQAMNEAGKSFETHWYEADHAFANPTTARYDEADASLAWERTLTFLNQHLS